MKNLLSETIEKLAENGKSTDDVSFVSFDIGNYRASHEAYSTWDEFASVAKDIDYDGGYGLQEISLGLVVVGNGWWLERHEYDGSEWWEYKVCPKIPKTHSAITRDDIVNKEWNRF